MGKGTWHIAHLVLSLEPQSLRCRARLLLSWYKRPQRSQVKLAIVLALALVDGPCESPESSGDLGSELLLGGLAGTAGIARCADCAVSGIIGAVQAAALAALDGGLTLLPFFIFASK